MWLGFGISDLATDQKQLNLEIADKAGNIFLRTIEKSSLFTKYAFLIKK